MNIIEVKNIVKSFEKHLALDDVSFNVPKNSIFGLLGPNGAGKTTLIRIITQIFGADSGEVLFNGQECSSSHIAKIGYLPEERGLYKKMTVDEQLLYLAQLKGLPKSKIKKDLNNWYEKLEITDWRKKEVGLLSKGMQQKVQFIATVLHNPELIILDEPFSGFDPLNANLIKREILELRKKGATIIFSTHRMESVDELCEHVVLINKSRKVLEGSKTQIKDSFKENKFEVICDSEISFTNGFDVLETVKDQQNIKYTIKLVNGSSPNHLVSEVIKQANLISFSEIIPTVNEIFIKVVNQ